MQSALCCRPIIAAISRSSAAGERGDNICLSIHAANHVFAEIRDKEIALVVHGNCNGPLEFSGSSKAAIARIAERSVTSDGSDKRRRETNLRTEADTVQSHLESCRLCTDGCCNRKRNATRSRKERTERDRHYAVDAAVSAHNWRARAATRARDRAHGI